MASRSALINKLKGSGVKGSLSEMNKVKLLQLHKELEKAVLDGDSSLTLMSGASVNNQIGPDRTLADREETQARSKERMAALNRVRSMRRKAPPANEFQQGAALYVAIHIMVITCKQTIKTFCFKGKKSLAREWCHKATRYI
jgi:hypothetical protein